MAYKALPVSCKNNTDGYVQQTVYDFSQLVTVPNTKSWI